MADRYALAAVTIPCRSGSAADAVVNTFAIKAPDPGWDPSVDFAEATVPLVAFYNGNPNLTGTTANYLSPDRDRTSAACSIDIYDITDHLDGSPHGSPAASTGWTLGAGSGSLSLPGEVATVVTIKALAAGVEYPVEAPDGADLGTAVDRPRQRHTGRWYIGPLNIDCMSSDANGVVRPSVSWREHLVAATQVLYDALEANGLYLGVWSRVNGAFDIPDRVVVDDAFDTQRRRGVKRTTATTGVLA